MTGRPPLCPIALAVAGALIAASGCSGPSPGAEGGRVSVVTTVSPITNLVQNVGGDRVEVTGIVPEGANSHTFEPAPTDARVLAEADVVFINGLHLEEPTRELAVTNVREGVEIVDLAPETIDPDDYIYDFSFPKGEGDPNPHLWTNPPYAKSYSDVIREKLSELDPQNTGYYADNYSRFASRLDQLDEAAREATATVPADHRKLLTYHDSFPYFAREYGWDIIGAIQPSDFSEPTAREVADLIDQIEAEDVPAIFGSEAFPSPVLEQIAQEADTRYVDDLRDDDLPGGPGDADHSYLGLMVFDFKTFMGALGGDTRAFDRIDLTNIAGEGTTEYR